MTPNDVPGWPVAPMTKWPSRKDGSSSELKKKQPAMAATLTIAATTNKGIGRCDTRTTTPSCQSFSARSGADSLCRRVFLRNSRLSAGVTMMATASETRVARMKARASGAKKAP